MKLHWAKHTAQKARREVEKNAREEAERQRVVEEEERKRRMVEYLQWLQDKMLEKEAALLEGAEGSQVMESKCKEITTRNEEGQQPSKKAKEKQPEKYYGGAIVKIEVLTPVRGV